jgi:phage-related minor tail protein
MGGPVAAGRPYLIGEQGPELFMPSSSGTIIPNNALGSAASSGAMMASGGSIVNYNVSVEVGPTADKAAIGKALVESISAFERRSGSGWRS